MVWLADVACSGMEQRLDNCCHSGWGEAELCFHTNDASIVCQSMSVCLSVCLFVFLSICLSVCLSICLANLIPHSVQEMLHTMVLEWNQTTMMFD